MSGGGGGIIIIRSLRESGKVTPDEVFKLDEIEKRMCGGIVENRGDLDALGRIAKAIAQRP